MRIERLDQNTKKNLLEDLLKRSPNSYGKYEESVREILDAVKERGDEALFEYPEDTFFLPAGTKYQLVNFENKPVKVVFAVTKL